MSTNEFAEDDPVICSARYAWSTPTRPAASDSGFITRDVVETLLIWSSVSVDVAVPAVMNVGVLEAFVVEYFVCDDGLMVDGFAAARLSNARKSPTNAATPDITNSDHSIFLFRDIVLAYLLLIIVI